MGRVNYERIEIPYNERQLKLDRMRQLLTRLGQPDAGMKIVHVAGTKGKGSTAAMIAGMLTAAGFRTGLFTSPHLERIEERFAVDGQPCSAAELVALVDRVGPVVTVMDGEADAHIAGPSWSGRDAVPPDQDGRAMCPTFFEIVTAIALLHFVERQVDAAVLEVGLGGRLDSTNVCLPAVSVITSISFDHTKQLGSTLAAIAHEKAGIIKPGVPVVSGVTDSEPQTVIAQAAREHGCRLIQLGRDFDFDYVSGDFGFRIADCGLKSGQTELNDIHLAMHGRHQAANAAVALAAVLELRRQGWCISTEAMRAGLAQTVVPARVEIISGRPDVVLDVAHNRASARALVEALAELPPPSRRTLILSISRDKDVRAIVAELVPHFDRVIITQYQENPRAVPAEELAAIVHELWEASPTKLWEASPTPIPRSPDVAIHRVPAEAWAYARQTAQPAERVCIAGSFFLAAEMRPLVTATLTDQN